jgi:YfiH family protein
LQQIYANKNDLIEHFNQVFNIFLLRNSFQKVLYLPVKNDMYRKSFSGLNLWQFENLSKMSSIKHFVSDRASHSNENEFTLSLSSSPDRMMVLRNRSFLASAMGIVDSELYFPSQVHKTKILHVSRATSRDELLETDALVTAEPRICIAVMSADCVPILLYDRKNRAVGAVHSGWRGTVARILEKSLNEMQRLFGTHGADVYAGIGPSVSTESYEVGEEVVAEVKTSFGKINGLLTPTQHGKAKLDLWKANSIQLREFGVPAGQIEVSNLCTVKNNQHFFSARKGDKGRFAAGIMVE